MMRDWKGSCIFRDVASHTATCFSSGRALAVLAKDGAVLAPRWRSLPTIQARQVVRATPLWANSGIPFASNQSPDKPPAATASPMKLQRLMATDRSEPGAERTSSPIFSTFHSKRRRADTTWTPKLGLKTQTRWLRSTWWEVSFIAQSLLLFPRG